MPSPTRPSALSLATLTTLAIYSCAESIKSWPLPFKSPTVSSNFPFNSSALDFNPALNFCPNRNIPRTDAASVPISVALSHLSLISYQS